MNPLPFAPNYEIGVNQLYEAFAAHVIRQKGSVDILNVIFSNPTRGNTRLRCPIGDVSRDSRFLLIQNGKLFALLGRPAGIQV